MLVNDKNLSTASGDEFKIEAFGKIDIKTSYGYRLKLKDVIICTNMNAQIVIY